MCVCVYVSVCADLCQIILFNETVNMQWPDGAYTCMHMCARVCACVRLCVCVCVCVCLSLYACACVFTYKYIYDTSIFQHIQTSERRARVKLGKNIVALAAIPSAPELFWLCVCMCVCVYKCMVSKN